MPTDKGTSLNRRVWVLLEKAGFDTKPNSNNPDEEAVVELINGKKRRVDLLAELPDLRVKIIGENKSRKRLDGSFSAYVHDYQELQKAAKANAVLFVSDDKDFDPNDKKYAIDKGFTFWEDEELDYYEVLVDTLGPYAKYEILHSMSIATQEQILFHNVLALHFHQPFSNSTDDLYVFTVSPELLLKTCVVLRKAAGKKDAYQRMVKKSRLNKIARFVGQSDSILPPNIVVHLSEKINSVELPIPEHDKLGRRITLSHKNNYDLVLLQIPLEYASMEIIDGQHRLFGFSNTEAATKESFNLVVLGLANMSPKRRTDTFVAINDNARRMDPNLVAYLKLTHDEVECQKDNELMAIKIVFELNHITPFKKKIRLLDKGNEKITLKNFAGPDLKSLIGERGLLRKYYSHQSDKYIAVLRMYFSILKSIFPNEWNDPDKYIMFTNRGISAFLKLLRSMLKTEEAPLTRPVITKYLTALENGWVGSWETKLLQSSYVGTQGRNDFHRDLVKAIQKKYPKFIQ
ncbi:MAG: DGQHR domain-containing protein [Chloroflexota bacterium]